MELSRRFSWRRLRAALALTFVLFALFALCSCQKTQSDPDAIAPDKQGVQIPGELAGVWTYDKHTTYEFAPDKTGSMTIDGQVFPFSFETDADQLKIDFVPENMRDCVYTFTVTDTTLKLIGGEGTVGGVYTLTRS